MPIRRRSGRCRCVYRMDPQPKSRWALDTASKGVDRCSGCRSASVSPPGRQLMAAASVLTCPSMVIYVRHRRGIRVLTRREPTCPPCVGSRRIAEIRRRAGGGSAPNLLSSGQLALTEAAQPGLIMSRSPDGHGLLVVERQSGSSGLWMPLRPPERSPSKRSLRSQVGSGQGLRDDASSVTLRSCLMDAARENNERRAPAEHPRSR
jgi:hypothetical protein